MPVQVAVLARAGVDLYSAPGVPLRDQAEYRRWIGSCGANTAVGIARLGAPCHLVTSVGADGHGDFLRMALADEGVATELLKTAPAGRTPLTFADIGLDGEAVLTAYRTTPSPDHLVDLAAHELEELLQAQVLYLTGTGFAAESSRDLHIRLLQQCAGRTVLDLDWRTAAWPGPAAFADALAPVLPLVDVVLGNEAEWERVGGWEVHRPLPHQVLIRKRGAAGLEVRTSQEEAFTPPHVVPVVSGLGSGDACGAAVVEGLLRERPLMETLARAGACGAIVATRIPCAEASPREEELRAFLGKAQARWPETPRWPWQR